MPSRKISFFEFWNVCPHLETSLEIAKIHLDRGDSVDFNFLGHDTLYKEQVPISPDLLSVKLKLMNLPEQIGIKLINHPKLNANLRNKIPTIPVDIPSEWDMETLKSFTYKNYKVGMATLSSLIDKTKSSNPDLSSHNTSITTMIQSGIDVYEFILDSLKQTPPDIVYIFNGRHIHSRALLNACQALDIEYLIHERGAHKDKYSVRSIIPHNLDKIQEEILQTWRIHRDNETAINIAHSFFKEQRNGSEIAWKSFVSNQAKGSIPSIPEGKKIVTYFSGSDDEFIGISDYYQWKFWNDQVHAVNSLVSIVKEIPELHLILRVHPHIKYKSEYDKKLWNDFHKYKHITVVDPDSSIDTYALMEASEKVIVSSSTTGIESVYWGTPTITLGPTLYSRMEATYPAYGDANLKELLLSNDLVADQSKSLPYGYYMKTFGTDFKYFMPTDLFNGTFLNKNLHYRSLPAKITDRLFKLYSALLHN